MTRLRPDRAHPRYSRRGICAITTSAVATLSATLAQAFATAQAAQTYVEITNPVGGPAPCITIDVASLSFGTMPFSSPRTPSIKTLGPTTVTNCSSAPGRLLAHGTDAFAGSRPLWTLRAPRPGCGSGTPTNAYGYDILTGPETTATTALTKTDQTVISITAGATQPLDHRLTMPCHGSSAATPISWQIIFTTTR